MASNPEDDFLSANAPLPRPADPTAEYVYGIPGAEQRGIGAQFLNMFAPYRSEVVTPASSRDIPMDGPPGTVLRIPVPGEYRDAEFGFSYMPIVQGVASLLSDPAGAAQAAASMPEEIYKQQAYGADAMSRGLDFVYDSETGEEYRYDPSLVPALTAAGTIKSIAKEGSDGTVLGIMGGRMAMSGPNKFSSAKSLLTQGKSDQEIFEQTGSYFDEGIFYSPSESFRFEIPTQNSTLFGLSEVDDKKISTGDNLLYHDEQNGVFGLKTDVPIVSLVENGAYIDIPKGSKIPILSQILDFPELYKEYPSLAKIPVVRFPGVGGAGYMHDGKLGDYDGPIIAVSYTNNAKKFQSNLLHEVQHAVQYKEQFPKGASPASIFERLQDLYPNADPDELRGRSEDLYNAVYGEVESRVVQRRFESPEEAMRTPIETRKKEASDTDVGLSEQDVVDIFEQGVADDPEGMGFDPNIMMMAPRPTAPKSPNTVLDEIYGQDTSISVGPFALPHELDHKVKLELLPDIDDPEGAINIAGIVSTGERGEGFGTRAMKLITGKADENNLGLTLEVDPVSRGGKPDLSKEDLVTFYEREGFIKVTKNYNSETKTTTYDPIDPETNKDRFGNEWIDEMYRPPVDGRMQSLPKVVKKAEGGVVTLADVARNTGRGPRGVDSLAPIARNMYRTMVS